MVIVKVRSQMVSSNNVPAYSRFEKALLHVAREVRPQSKRGLAQKAFEFVGGVVHYHHRHQAALSKSSIKDAPGGGQAKRPFCEAFIGWRASPMRRCFGRVNRR